MDSGNDPKAQLSQLTETLGAYGQQMKLQKAAASGTAGEFLHKQITDDLTPAKARQRHGQVDLAPHDAFTTKLNDTEEKQFQVWRNQWAPRDSGFNYDLRGAFKEGLLPDEVTGHWSDRYKKPNHETYSVESVYAAEHGNPGTWTGKDHDIYVPGTTPRATTVGLLDPVKVTDALTTGMLPQKKSVQVQLDNGLLDPKKVTDYLLTGGR